MAAGMFPSPTRSQCNPRSFPRLPSSFSHGSPSFPRGHADQGGRPGAGSAASLLGGGDGGSRGGAAGWSILESWRPSMNGGGAARGGVDGASWALRTCPVCSRSFHGPAALLYLHMKICQPTPAAAAAAQPPALLPQQDRENMPSMAWARTRPHEPASVARAAHVPTVLEVLRPMFPWLREEDLSKPWFVVFVRAAEEIVSMSAAEPAVYRDDPVYVRRLLGVMVLKVKPKAPAVPTYPVLNSAVLAAAATVAIAPPPPAPAPFVPAAGAPKASAAPLATPAAFGRGSSGAGAGAGAGAIKKGYACSQCGKTFKSGQALGGHVTGRHRRVTTSVLARIPAANIGTPSIATRKRPATEAASPGNAKRRCIRLFGVDIAVEAPKE